MPAVDRLRSSLHPVVRQLVKFGMVGGAGFVVDVGGFNLLRFAGGEGPLYDYPLTAKVVSGAAATVVSWLGNRYWTFRHTRRDAAHHEFVLFAVMASIGTGIAMLCLWFSHYVLDFTSPIADNIAANGVGLALAMAFRFWAYRRHVFSNDGDGTLVGEVAAHQAHPVDERAGRRAS
ncbi:MAG: GtrA family protein [Phycicoccus sp.]